MVGWALVGVMILVRRMIGPVDAVAWAIVPVSVVLRVVTVAGVVGIKVGWGVVWGGAVGLIGAVSGGAVRVYIAGC